MRQRVALIVAALAACTDGDGGGAPGVQGTSFVEHFEIPGLQPPRLDLLIVVDNTATMASHQHVFAPIAAALETFVTAPDGVRPDVRIAVATSDTAEAGTLRQPAGVSEPFLAAGFDGRLAPVDNHDGTLASAVTALLDVGTASVATVKPLQAAYFALEANPDIVRADAGLGVLTIAGTDDASPGSVSSYVTSLEGRKLDPTNIMVSGVYPTPSTRLDAYHDMFFNRSVVTSIDTGDPAEAIASLASLFRSHLAAPCTIEPSDVDPTTPGPQYDCSIEAVYEDDAIEVLPLCSGDDGTRCVSFKLAPQLCPLPGTVEIGVTGFPGRYRPALRGQCVVIH